MSHDDPFIPALLHRPYGIIQNSHGQSTYAGEGVTSGNISAVVSIPMAPSNPNPHHTTVHLYCTKKYQQETKTEQDFLRRPIKAPPDRNSGKIPSHSLTVSEPQDRAENIGREAGVYGAWAGEPAWCVGGEGSEKEGQ